LPLVGFLILAFWGKKLGRTSGIIGMITVGISAVITILIGIQFLQLPASFIGYQQTLWKWFEVAGFTSSVTLSLDPLALVFIFIVTFVSFLIHWYSIEYMEGDERYSLFFAYMNLFVFSMLVLVLANDLLLLYLGWEGVGLCSYLLIGFWYKDPYND